MSSDSPPDQGAAGRSFDAAASSRVRASAPPPSCVLGRCDGTGWLETDDRVVEPCECRNSASKRMRGVASAIPARFRGVSFDRPPIATMAAQPGARIAVNEVRRYVDGLDQRLADGVGFWLTGDIGTGKTSLAMLISKAALEAGHSVAIYSLPRLLARIRRTYDGDPSEDSYLPFFERLTSVDLLHIDDLGVEKRSDWVLEQLYAIVDERYQSRRSVIVTTNLAEDALEDQIGHRTVSRLVEMCGAVGPQVLSGSDQRYLAVG